MRTHLLSQICRAPITSLIFCGLCCCQNQNAPTKTPEPPPKPETTSSGPPSSLPQQVADQPDSKARSELLLQLWGTPLGKMFYAYLFETNPSEPPSVKAQEIIDRVYSNVRLTLTRVSSLQMMIEDLYDRQVITTAIHDRVSLLETKMDLKQQVLQSKASHELVDQLPVFLPIAFLGGSPLIRNSVLNGTQGALQYLLALVGGRSTAQARHVLAEIPWKKVASTEVFHDYNPYQSLNVFVSSFAGYSIVYYALKTGSTESINIQDKVWLYGIQNFIDLAEI
jgi:hypothetical protein